MIRRLVLPAGIAAALLTAACQNTPNDTNGKPAMAPERAMYLHALAIQAPVNGAPDLTGARELLEKAADAGSADAMDRLGDMYRMGDGGVARDLNQALSWYKREGELSKTRPGIGSWGLIKTGQMYEYGQAGLEKSSLDADEWYKRAAATARQGTSNNEPAAVIAFSYLLAAGRGVKEDDIQAWNWAIKALDLDRAHAYDLMAEFYAYGQGIAPNENESFRCSLQAAQLGLVDDMVETSLGFMTGKGAPQDTAAGMEWIQRAIERGNSRAMRELGNYYHNGAGGLPRNDQTARQWYQKAIDQNDPAALGLMGQLSLPRDPADAATWFEKGQKAGDPASTYWLAMVYIDPTGTTMAKDLAKANELLKESAADGFAPAMTRLGQVYEEGVGVSPSLQSALSWYRRASEAGDPEGMYRLASLLAGQLRAAGLIPDTYMEAKSWLIKSATAGYGPAMTVLGMVYSHGVGADRYDRDPVAGAKWYEKGARAGERTSMREYGELLVEGRYVSRDFRAARGWFDRASQLGDTISLIDIGQMYEKGQGEEINYDRAMQYYQEADRRGEPSAKASIAHMYQDGLGVKQDGAAAIKLLEQGAAANNLDALEMLAQTYEYGKGTLTDISKARGYYTRAAALGSDLAATWLENHPSIPTPTLPGTQPGQPTPPAVPGRGGRGARGGAGSPNPAQPQVRPPGR